MPTQPDSELLVHLGLGSNLDHPCEQLQQGLRVIETRLPLRSFQCSPFYQSPPMGGMEQPDYINAVCKFHTEMTAHELLAALRLIEDERGRQRKEHWGSRTLDIDILLMGNVVSQDKDLTIPHSGMESRDFVLVPLLDISPDIIHPVSGKPYRDSLNELLKTSPLTIQPHHEGYLQNH